MTVVELAPEFIKKMADAKVTAGEAAAFEIELSKGDAMTKWYKNGAEIDLSTKRIGLKIDGKKQGRNSIASGKILRILLSNSYTNLKYWTMS